MKHVLTTQFITAEVVLQQTPADMRQAIDVELSQHGEPLRWAVVAVDIAAQKAIVEAIVTRKDEG